MICVIILIMSISFTRKITISTPARLHLGFIDLHGSLGRRFGSAGIALDAPRLELEITPSEALDVQGENSERIAKLVESFDKYYEVTSRCNIRLRRTIPAHKGLGSGTQTALAVGQGLATLHGLTLTGVELARCLGRGRRSGIGIYAFDCGGVLVDAGVKGNDLPTLIFHHPFPSAWRILLIMAKGEEGLHGANELTAFEQLPQFSKSCAGALSRTVIMKLMPSVIEQDFASFAQAVHKLQSTMTDYFSSVQEQEISRFNPAKLLEYLNKQGIKGIGQTSWGPTAFAIVESQAQAEVLKARLMDYVQSHCQTEPDALKAGKEIDFLIVKGDNKGAVVASD